MKNSISGVKAIIGTNEDEGAAFVNKNAANGDINANIFEPLFRSNAPMAKAYYQTRLKTDSPYTALVQTLTQYM